MHHSNQKNEYLHFLSNDKTDSQHLLLENRVHIPQKEVLHLDYQDQLPRKQDSLNEHYIP